ncbi:MAG: hypothetical protein IT352_07515 [Gemmatimonadales bacterium]|nr:hypothetical protein [Gemmatimonadales bacterium]
MPAGTITPTQVQTDWLCNSGTVLTALPATTAWTLEQTIENYLVMKRVTLSGPMDGWDGFSHLAVGRVIRLDYRDASTTPATDDWEEYRLTDLVIDQATRTWTATGVWWIQDLLEKDALLFQTVGSETRFDFAQYAVTPTNALNTVDASLPSYWSLNTVTPTTAGDVTYARSTPMAGGLAIAAMAKRMTGTTYELWPSRNGTTGLYLNLSVYGTGSVDARLGKNLIGLRTTKRRHEQTTRVAFTEDLALQRPTYVITAISAGAYIEVQDVNALGPGPAREDDQWNTSYYWYEEKNHTGHQITDTVKVDYTTTRLHMSSTTGMVVGERGFLAANSSVADVVYVDSPSLQTTYGKRLGIIAGGDGVTNYARNADFRNGTSSTPTGWSVTLGTPVKVDVTTGLVRYGGYGYKLQSDTIVMDPLTIYCVAGEVWSIGIGLFINTFGGGGITIQNPQTGTGTVRLIDGTVAGLDRLNTYLEWVETFDITSSGAKTFNVTVSVSGGTSVVTVDNLQIVRSATYPTFRVGSGAADNIALANAHLDTNGDPIATYDVEVADLALLAPRTYGDDRPGLGSTCYLTDDADLDREALRIVAMTVDSRRPLTPRLQLSNRPRRLTSLLVS